MQLETYEKVLSSAVGAMRGRPAPVPGGLALGDADSSPDVAEARREKVDPEEYLWVRERVLEAEATVGTAKLNADAIGVLERTLAELRSRRGAAADDGSRKLLDEQVTIFSGEVERLRKESREPEAESVRDNVRLIEPRRLRLEALEDEFRRLSSPAPSPAQPKAPTPAASPAPHPAAGPR